MTCKRCGHRGRNAHVQGCPTLEAGTPANTRPNDAAPSVKQGWVYFVDLVSKPLVKIGMTTRSLPSRLKSIESDLKRGLRLTTDAHAWFPGLELIGAVRVDDARGTERALHYELREHGRDGEWFTRCTEVLSAYWRLASVSSIYHDRCLRFPNWPIPVEFLSDQRDATFVERLIFELDRSYWHTDDDGNFVDYDPDDHHRDDCDVCWHLVHNEWPEELERLEDEDQALTDLEDAWETEELLS